MTVLVSDSFNRANSTVSLGNTDSAYGGTVKTWVTNSTTWGISSNQAYPVTVVDNMHAYINSDISDGYVSATFAVVATRTRLMFRYSDASNYLYANAYGTEYRVYTVIGGTHSSIASNASFVPSNGDIVKVELNGSTIKLYVNGTLAITTTSTHNQTATQHGLNVGSTASTSRFDDFKVEDFNTGGTPITITSAVANSTADAIAPSVSTVSSISTSIDVIAATLVADSISPSISVSSNVSLITVVTDATANALIPQVGSFTNISVNAVIVSATVDTLSPSVNAVRNIGLQSVTADMTADTITPSIQTDAIISAIIAELQAEGTTPIFNAKLIISTIRLKGSQQLNVFLHGKKELNVQLQGKQALNVNLKGVIN